MSKRWILPVILLALSSAVAYGQSVSQGGGGSAPQSGSGAPANPCAQALQLYINTANGDLYTCPSAGANWVKWPTAGATPSAGSAGNLQYAGAGNTFAATSDFNVSSHTLSGGASAIFDMHLAATTGVLLPGGLSTGLLRVTTSTGAIASSELSGDCVTTGSNATVCLSTNGVAFAASATTNTVVASNITSGLLPLAQGGAHTSLAATGGAHFVLQQSTVGGNISVGQLACADLSNSVASCSSDATIASNITSGTLPAARLPNPSASTLGGIESFTAVSNQWIRSISTAGVPASSQPNFTDLAGNIAIGQITALSTNNSILIRDNTGALNQITAASIGAGNCVGANGSPVQFTGLTCAGGSGGANGVNAKTANYTLASGDNAKNVTFNGSSLTATLPASPPSATWTSWVENLNASNLVVSPNGLTVNGSSSNITLGPFQSVYVWTDNTNYFATGLPVLAGSGLTPAYSGLGLSLSLNTAVALTHSLYQAGGDIACVPSGGVTAYTCNLAVALTSYTANQHILFVPDVNSATSASVQINGIGSPVSIKKIDGTTDPGTTIVAGQPQWMVYDGTVFRLLGSGGGGGGTPCTSTALSLQYNNASAFGCLAEFTYASSTITASSSGKLDLSAASPTAGLKLPSAAGAIPTADGFPAVNTTNHTLVYGSNGTTLVSAVAATGTNTATTCTNQAVTAVSGVAIPTCSTITPAFASGNTSGSGNFVLVTSATLVTPLLGTPTSGTLTNTTGYLWNNLANPGGNFNPSMGGNTSEFDYSSALNHGFQWYNTTAATSGTSQNGPILDLSCGNEWHGAASVKGCVSLQFVPGNGTDAASTIALTHFGTATGTPTLTTPGPIATPLAPTFVAGSAGTWECAEGGVPTGPLSGGDILYCANGTWQLRENNSTQTMYITKTLSANVTPVTVNANVTTDQNLMAFSINANTLNLVSRTLRVSMAGIYTTAAANTSTISVKVKLCSVSGCGSGFVTTIASFVSTANAGGVTNLPWNANLLSTTQTAGATAVFEAHGALTIDLTSAVASSVFPDTSTAVSASADTTSGLNLQVTAAFSSASASNTFTERQLTVELLQ